MAVEKTIVLRHSDKLDAENQGSGMPNYLGAVAISPDGRSGVGAVEAGQHRPRHAAQRREPQLPEHGARDQLAARSRGRCRGLRAPHRPRQREPRERGGLRSARRLPVRRARDEPRSGGARRARRSRAVPHRRRPRAAGPGAVAGRPAAVTSTTSWIARSACTTSPLLQRHGQCDGAARSRPSNAVATEKLAAQGAAGQAVLLRRARHASRARRAT